MTQKSDIVLLFTSWLNKTICCDLFMQITFLLNIFSFAERNLLRIIYYLLEINNITNEAVLDTWYLLSYLIKPINWNIIV